MKFYHSMIAFAAKGAQVVDPTSREQSRQVFNPARRYRRMGRGISNRPLWRGEPILTQVWWGRYEH